MGVDLSNLFELLRPWLDVLLGATAAALLGSALWFGAYFLLMRLTLGDKAAWNRPTRLAGWLIVTLIAGSVVWSIWFESLGPYLRAGKYRAFLMTAAGILGMLLGMGLVLYGGAKSLRNMLRMYGSDEEFRRTLTAVDAKRSPTVDRRTRWQNLKKVLGMIWRAWSPGTGWLMMGLGLMVGPAGYLVDFDLGLDPVRMALGLGLMVVGGLLGLGGKA